MPLSVMSVLTSLLVRDSVVPIRTIEEAIQRQVISGGDLPTVLLEMGAVPENVLSSYLAAQHGLLPAGREEVMEIPAHLLTAIPREIAIEHRILPVGEADERLVVASAAPLERDQRRELSFVLGRPIENRIAVDIRISAGLERHYGEPASRREQRILRKIAERAPGELRDVAPLDPNRAIRASADEAPTDERTGGAPTRYLNEKARTQRASIAPAGAEGWAKRKTESLAPVRPVEHRHAANPSEPSRRALARPGSALVDRHRGPLTARDAVNMLSEAETRDDILAVSMAFVRQFFDCTLLFVVHDEEAEGLDAHGVGPSWKEVQRISVPLDAEGTFRAAREALAPRVGELGGTAADDEFLAQTGRKGAQPALVAPVLIRQRVILFLYADRNGEPFELADVPEVVAFLPRISDAIQRLILKRKAAAGRSTGQAPSEPKPAAAPAPRAFASKKPADSGDWTQTPKAPPVPREFPPECRRKPSYAMSVPAEPPPAMPRPEAFDLLGVPREAPPPPEAAALRRAKRPPIDTTYRARDAGVEVVETARISVRPPGAPASASVPTSASVSLPLPPKAEPPAEPARAWVSRDARREQDGASPPVDIVNLPDPRPPSTVPPRRPAPVEVPSIIVQNDVDVASLLAQLTAASPEHADEIIPLLVASGPDALPALAQAFPGRLWTLRSAGPLIRGRDVSGVARALCAFGAMATGFVAPLLARPDGDERYFALAVAKEIFTHELAPAVEPLLYDNDREIRRHAAELLRTLDPASPARREVLDHTLLRARSERTALEHRLHAISALGAFADTDLVPSLIELLEDPEPTVQGAAMAALTLVTAQDFGTASRKWIAWYERSRDRHRIEWLIDGLMHESESVRRVAGAELQRITREYYGYHPVLPKREREILQRRYRTWWETTGRAQFA